MREAPGPIIFYDGVCGLCNGLVRFMLRRDRPAIFRFATLQSDFAGRTLEAYGRNPGTLDTVYVMVDPGRPSERLLHRGQAWTYILGRLGGVWKLVSLFRFLPGPLLDFGYNVVARTRYRLFGGHDQCPLPDPRWQERFIDAP